MINKDVNKVLDVLGPSSSTLGIKPTGSWKLLFIAQSILKRINIDLS